MTLGERCDEIVRLIDATLADCAPSTPARSGEHEGAPAVEGPVTSRVRGLARGQRASLPRTA